MAEYPSRPAGTLDPTQFYLVISDSAWVGDAPAHYYMYAIIDASHCAAVWDDSCIWRPRRIMVSRGLSITDDSEYGDCWWWWPPFDSQTQILSTGDDPITSSNWSTYQEQSQYTRNNRTWGGMNSPAFAVLEIACWDNTESRTGCVIGGLSVQSINDDDFDEPGASANHEHAEMMRTTTSYTPYEFASAYHAMWGIADSANKMMYEDRQHNMWPVWGPQVFE